MISTFPISLYLLSLLLGTLYFQLQPSLTFAWILEDGPCKNQCDKVRGGGPFSFKLECKSKYITEQEQNHCINVCVNECPIESCSNNTILCGAQTKEAQEIEKEENRVKLERENELKELMDTIDSIKTWIFVLAVLIIFASFGSICGVIVTWRVMSSNEERAVRPDKHTTALGSLFIRRQKEVKVIPPQEAVPFTLSAAEAGIGPVLIE